MISEVWEKKIALDDEDERGVWVIEYVNLTKKGGKP